MGSSCPDEASSHQGINRTEPKRTLSANLGVADPVRRLRPVHRRRQSASTASLSRFGRTSIGVSAFDAVLKQLAGLGVDTDFVRHATILDIEGIA
jgi:hypothetical protein